MCWPLIGTNKSSISISSVKTLGCHRSAIAESAKLDGKEKRDAFVTARNLFGGETPAASHLREPIQNLHLASPTNNEVGDKSAKDNLCVLEASLMDKLSELEKKHTELSPLRKALSPINSNAKPKTVEESYFNLKPMTPKTLILSANAKRKCLL